VSLRYQRLRILRPLKINQKKKIAVDDVRNRLEVYTLKALRAGQKAGGYQITYEQEALEYVLVKRYVPDFILEFPSGRKRYIESKGYLRPDDMKKMIAVRDQHPDLDIKIYFAKDNKLNRKAKMRYSDWAIKHGFDFAVGYIPEEWMRDE
jgi:hypothetical protein